MKPSRSGQKVENPQKSIFYLWGQKSRYFSKNKTPFKNHILSTPGWLYASTCSCCPSEILFRLPLLIPRLLFDYPSSSSCAVVFLVCFFLIPHPHRPLLLLLPLCLLLPRQCRLLRLLFLLRCVASSVSCSSSCSSS